MPKQKNCKHLKIYWKAKKMPKKYYTIQASFTFLRLFTSSC